MSTCKSCGAPIVFVESTNHKWIPCNEGLIPYRIDNDGKDAIVTGRGQVIRCRLQFDGEPDGMGRISHFATCPNANKYRRRK